MSIDPKPITIPVFTVGLNKNPITPLKVRRPPSFVISIAEYF